MSSADANGSTSPHYDGYMDDRPVGMDEDLLWADAAVRTEIDRIATKIVAALDPRDARAARSLTFAIHGKWGMGKSSILRMIRERAVQLAQEHHLNSENLKFCIYQAPVYESSPFDVRISLAFKILSSIKNSASEAIKILLKDVAAFMGMSSLTPAGASIESNARDTYILQNIAGSMATLVDHSLLLREYLNPRDGANRVLVVMIDDLDRCSDQDFVWRVIDAIQQYSDTPNLFFVLAVERERLLKAVQKRLEQSGVAVDTEYALEKYVQISVDVPDLEEEGLRHYVEALLNRHAHDEAFTNALVSNTVFLSDGLRELTPRSIKRCLNAIERELKQRIAGIAPAASGSQANDRIQREVKASILQYVWPTFFRRLYVPAVIKQDVVAGAAFGQFEDLANTYAQRRDDEQLRLSLQQFDTRNRANRLNLARLDIAIDTPAGFEDAQRLALYMGRPPFWNFGGGFDRSYGSGFQGGGPGGGKTPVSPIEGLAGQQVKSNIASDRSDALNEFLRLYVASELGYEQEQKDATLKAARELYKLVTNNRVAFDKERAGQVGNVAINAERFDDIELAINLYELALDLNPEHSNNLQNYADLIVTRPLPDYFPRAKEILALLKTGKHREHRFERTLALDAQLRSKMGEDNHIEADSEQVESIVNTFLADPTNVQLYIGLMGLLTQAEDYSAIRRISLAMYTRAQDEYGRYVPLRAYADTLAASPSTDNELQAMDIYRYILANFSDSKVEDDRAKIMQNFATLLYKHDYDPEAGEMWYQSYQLDPNNNNIRNAYSMYLIRANRSDIANIVIDGKPLAEVVRQPQTKRMPDRFWGGTDRWWERPSGSGVYPAM